jgi:hypothetical protein
MIMAQFSNWENNKLIVDAHHKDLRHSAQVDHPWQDEPEEVKADDVARRNRVVAVIAGLFAFVIALVRHQDLWSL